MYYTSRFEILENNGFLEDVAPLKKQSVTFMYSEMCLLATYVDNFNSLINSCNTYYTFF